MKIVFANNFSKSFEIFVKNICYFLILSTNSGKLPEQDDIVPNIFRLSRNLTILQAKEPYLAKR